MKLLLPGWWCEFKPIDMKKSISFVLLLVLMSCVNGKKEKTNEIESSKENTELKVEQKGFVISIQMELIDTDEIGLNYISEYEEGFIPEQTISKKVKGKYGIQEIVFDLPKDIDVLRRVRLNLGANSEAKTIKFYSIIISKDSKTWKLNIKDVERYFNTSEALVIDTENSEFNFDPKNKNQYPFLISKWSLGTEISTRILGIKESLY